MDERLKFLGATSPLIYNTISRLAAVPAKSVAAWQEKMLLVPGCELFAKHEFMAAFDSPTLCPYLNHPLGRGCKDVECRWYNLWQLLLTRRDHRCWYCGESSHGAWEPNSKGDYKCEWARMLWRDMTLNKVAEGEIVLLSKHLRKLNNLQPQSNSLVEVRHHSEAQAVVQGNSTHLNGYPPSSLKISSVQGKDSSNEEYSCDEQRVQSNRQEEALRKCSTNNLTPTALGSSTSLCGVQSDSPVQLAQTSPELDLHQLVTETVHAYLHKSSIPLVDAIPLSSSSLSSAKLRQKLPSVNISEAVESSIAAALNQFHLPQTLVLELQKSISDAISDILENPSTLTHDPRSILSSNPSPNNQVFSIYSANATRHKPSLPIPKTQYERYFPLLSESKKHRYMETGNASHHSGLRSVDEFSRINVPDEQLSMNDPLPTPSGNSSRRTRTNELPPPESKSNYKTPASVPSSAYYHQPHDYPGFYPSFIYHNTFSRGNHFFLQPNYQLPSSGHMYSPIHRVPFHYGPAYQFYPTEMATPNYPDHHYNEMTSLSPNNHSSNSPPSIDIQIDSHSILRMRPQDVISHSSRAIILCGTLFLNDESMEVAAKLWKLRGSEDKIIGCIDKLNLAIHNRIQSKKSQGMVKIKGIIPSLIINNERYYALVMERASWDLSQFTEQLRGGALAIDRYEFQDIIIKLLVAYRRSQTFSNLRMVRDLNPDHVLIFRQNNMYQVKFSDLSFSSIIHEHIDVESSRSWMAPEVLRGTLSTSDIAKIESPDYNVRRAELWSLGVIIYFLATGTKLSSSDDPFESVKALNTFNSSKFVCMANPELDGTLLSDLVSRMVHLSPEERLSIPFALTHPALWSLQKRALFMNQLVDEANKRKEDFVHFMGEINKIRGRWKPKFPMQYDEYLLAPNDIYTGRWSDLLRVTRNAAVHVDDTAWDDVFGLYGEFFGQMFDILLRPEHISILQLLSRFSVVYKVEQ